MPYWLMKSEPDEFSITDLEKRDLGRWDGVRNYQARNFLRAMQPGDSFFFYHSSCAVPGIAGIGRIASSAYPDPTALDQTSPYYEPKATAAQNPWSAVDVEHTETFTPVVPLTRLKGESALSDFALLRRGNRLSVMPVSDAHWQHILGLYRA